MKKVLILAANGQIARLVEDRVLNEDQFSDVELTLFLRNKSRLNNLKDNPRVTLIDGDINDVAQLKAAAEGQDMIFSAVVDHDPNNTQTRNIIEAMNATGVKRVVQANVLGIYDEVPGEFGRWNKEQIGGGMAPALKADQLLEESGLNYTTLRLPWLNDLDVKYTVTHKNEKYVGVSGSRKSMADVILKIVADFDYLKNDSVGIADPDTQKETRPVY